MLLQPSEELIFGWGNLIYEKNKNNSQGIKVTKDHDFLTFCQVIRHPNICNSKNNKSSELTFRYYRRQDHIKFRNSKSFEFCIRINLPNFIDRKTQLRVI